MRSFVQKISVSLLLTFLVACFLCGCSGQKEELDQQIAEAQTQLQELQEEKASLEQQILDTRKENGLNQYVVTFEVKQSHMPWDLENNFKDELNKTEFSVLVSKEYYDSVEVGTVISDDFRIGSFALAGSIGSWDITVKDKQTAF